MIRSLHPSFSVACGLLLLIASASRPAHADSVTAEALFQSGREALDKGDVKTACDRFEESYRLDATPGTALNLGNCREQLGQVASAWQRFQEAAQRLPSGDPRVTIANQRALALESQVPKLVLRAPVDTQGWAVLRDGVELGHASLNLALPLDPGPHQIEVRAPGRKPWRAQVQTALGQQSELVLERGEAGDSAPPPSSTPAGTLDSRSSTRHTLGWVLGGVGVVGIATGLTTGALVISKGSTVDKECPQKRCSQAGLDAADAGRTFSTVSTVAFAAGAVALTAGIYFIVTDDTPKQDAALRSRRPAAKADTRLQVAAAPGAVAFQLRSSF